MATRRAIHGLLLASVGALAGALAGAACSSSTTERRGPPEAVAGDAGAGGSTSAPDGGAGGAGGAGGSAPTCTTPDGGAPSAKGDLDASFDECAAQPPFVRRLGRIADASAFRVALGAGCTLAYAAFYAPSDAPLADDGGAPTRGLVVGRLAESGSVLWQRTVATPEPQALSIAMARTGEVYVATFAGAPLDFGDGLTDCGHCLAKYDATGALAWVRALDGAGSGAVDPAIALGVDGEGTLLVAATLRGALDFGLGEVKSNERGDVLVLALDPAGAPTWQRRIGGPADQIADALAVDASGFAAVAGRSIDPGSGATGALVVVVGPNGQEQWRAEEAPTAAKQARASRVAIGATGRVAAILEPVGRSDAPTLRVFEASGAKAWDAAVRLRATGVGLDDAGRVVVLGEPDACPVDLGGGALAPTGGADGALVVRDGAGAHLRSRRFRGVPDAVAFDPTGAIGLFGTARGGSIDLADGLALEAEDAVGTFAARIRP